MGGQPIPTREGSWKDICQLQVSEPRLREKMTSGLAMELGNGRTIQFWEDRWLPAGVLKDMFPRFFSVSSLHESVIADCGFWDGLAWIWSFQWRSELFKWELDLVNQLHKILQSFKLTNEREDSVEEVLPEEVTSYRFTSAVWKGFVPPRVELLSWFVLVGRVNTKDQLCRLWVIDQQDNRCLLCCKHVETTYHLFLGCEIT
ncbi:uncharacterized protein [Arachis hypogaea]|uniref:uncharacterized protein n=1 Tax=Arachis hypogaea TaxID=3818 RepID=UPI0010FC6421|nr:uncharacterized protein LOC114924460 [Arachis hypogaea]